MSRYRDDIHIGNIDRFAYRRTELDVNSAAQRPRTDVFHHFRYAGPLFLICARNHWKKVGHRS